MPVLGVTAVGKDMARNARYFRLACRMSRGAGRAVRQDLLRRRGLRERHGFVPGADRHGRRQEAARAGRARPWPIKAVSEGASGVDMGRNIFQSEAPDRDDHGRREGRP